MNIDYVLDMNEKLRTQQRRSRISAYWLKFRQRPKSLSRRYSPDIIYSGWIIDTSIIYYMLPDLAC